MRRRSESPPLVRSSSRHNVSAKETRLEALRRLDVKYQRWLRDNHLDEDAAFVLYDRYEKRLSLKAEKQFRRTYRRSPTYEEFKRLMTNARNEAVSRVEEHLKRLSNERCIFKFSISAPPPRNPAWRGLDGEDD
jgi:hypothetical protein